MRLWLLIAALIGIGMPQHGLAEPGDTRPTGLRLSAGFGLGTRAFVIPTTQGVQQLADTVFPATEFLAALRLGRQRRLGLDVSLAYQTSVQWRLEYQPLFALPEKIAARSQRVELGVAPRLRFASTQTALSLAAVIGFGLRSFWPRPKQFPIQDYLLGGPQLRVEFEFPLVERVRLRAGPELQWLVVTHGVALAPDVGGLAFGGEILLEASINAGLCFAFAYRESRSWIPTGTFVFEDTERFITARLSGEL